MTKRRATAVAAALTVPLLLGACSHAVAKPLPPPVTLGYCGSNPQVMPDVVLVVCATDDITAEHLVWSDWGAPSADSPGYFGGQNQPVPPRDQTVSLTC
jgi:hypothetical protein